jgi:hypothetical protein
MKKPSQEIIDILDKTSTQRFLKAARQFIELLENGGLTPKLFYTKSHQALAYLYSSGLELELVDLKYSDSKTKFVEIDQEKLRAQNKNLISKLGKACFYWEVFDPTIEEEDEPIKGWIVDDFANIYANLKEELYKIDEIATDESIEDALWQLKFGFNHHWGNHCIDAMRALHYLGYEGKVVVGE